MDNPVVLTFTPDNVLSVLDHQIFVFGSNLSGYHTSGLAKLARQNFGARYGLGEGISGRCYALPVKDENLVKLPLKLIHFYVKRFIDIATLNPSVTFLLTKVGCGKSGYRVEDIAPMFKNVPSNVVVPVEFYNFNYSN